MLTVETAERLARVALEYVEEREKRRLEKYDIVVSFIPVCRGAEMNLDEIKARAEAATKNLPSYPADFTLHLCKYFNHYKEDVPALIAEVERWKNACAQFSSSNRSVLRSWEAQEKRADELEAKLAAIRKAAEPIAEVLENIRNFGGGNADVNVYVDNKPHSVKFIIPLDSLRTLAEAIKED